MTKLWMYLNKNMAVRNAILVIFTHLTIILLSYIPGIRGVDLMTSLTESDQLTYIKPAINLIENGMFSGESVAPFLWEPYRTPGLPLFIILSIILTKTILLTPIIICLIAGIAAFKGTQLLQILNCNNKTIIAFGFLFAFFPNSLGLSCFLLTDALFGYLNLIWFYYLFIGFSRKSLYHIAISVLVLCIAQLIKPTLSIAWVLILIISIVYAFKNKYYWKGAIITVISSFIVPAFLSVQNYKEHGVYSPSLLGELTKREYLIADYLALKSGNDFFSVRDAIRMADRKDANHLKSNQSFYGKLYTIEKHKNDSILKNDPLPVLYICSKAFFTQIIAPQEFIFNIFSPQLSPWVRGFGFVLNILFLFLIIKGILICIKLQYLKIIIILVIISGFYLAAGTLSSRQGARLRFPSDILFLPIAAIGLSSIKYKKNA